MRNLLTPGADAAHTYTEGVESRRHNRSHRDPESSTKSRKYHYGTTFPPVDLTEVKKELDTKFAELKDQLGGEITKNTSDMRGLIEGYYSDSDTQ